MSIDVLHYQGYRIIYLDLEGVTDHNGQLQHVATIGRMAEESDGPILLLVNMKDFMPTKDYMDFASKESEVHRDKVGKAAYYNVDRSNRALFELYDRFDTGIKNRKTLTSRNEALEWLIAD